MQIVKQKLKNKTRKTKQEKTTKNCWISHLKIVSLYQDMPVICVKCAVSST